VLASQAIYQTRYKQDLSWKVAACRSGADQVQRRCLPFRTPVKTALRIRNACRRAARFGLLQVAGAQQLTWRQRLQIFKGYFHSVALHDVFHG